MIQAKYDGYEYVAIDNSIYFSSTKQKSVKRKKGRKIIAFIIDSPIHNPPLTGIIYRLVNITKGLFLNGHRIVWIIGNRNFYNDGNLKTLKNIPAKIHIVPIQDFYNHSLIREILKKESVEFVVFEITQSAVYFANEIKKYIPNIPIILECHDIEAHLKEYEHSKKLQALQKFLQYYASIIVDAVIVITPKDKDTIIKSIGVDSKKIFLVPNGIWPNNYKTLKHKQKNRLELLFIGNLFYPPNQEGLDMFIKQVFNKLKNTYPQITLKVIGLLPPKVKMRYEKDSNVFFLGPINDFNIYSKEISKSDIAICPIVSGSGMKTKMLEYSAAGLPIITTPLGLSGFEKNKNLIVCEQISHMGKEIINLMKNEEKMASIGEENRKFVANSLSWRQIVLAFNSVLFFVDKINNTQKEICDYKPTWLNEGREPKRPPSKRYKIIGRFHKNK